MKHFDCSFNFFLNLNLLKSTASLQWLARAKLLWWLLSELWTTGQISWLPKCLSIIFGRETLRETWKAVNLEYSKINMSSWYRSPSCKTHSHSKVQTIQDPNTKHGFISMQMHTNFLSQLQKNNRFLWLNKKLLFWPLYIYWFFLM